jgi:uncharacterized protein YcbX
MVVDAHGKFVTQRTHPDLTLVRVAVTEGGLRVERDGAPPLLLPSLFSDGPRVPFEIWRDVGAAVAHAEGGAWFSSVLGTPVQLLCMADDVQRAVSHASARSGELVSFADGFPYLVVNEASLADLNLRSNLQTEVQRFRPNLLIAGAPPWAEDDWRELDIGGIRFRLVKPCARCTIPLVDPETGEVGKEPIRTLATFRTREQQVYFGINAIADGTGELRVGDRVELIS